MRSLVPQIQLPLHRQFWMREFSFALSLCLFGHPQFLQNEQVETNVTGFKSGDKQSADFCDEIRQVIELQMIT